MANDNTLGAPTEGLGQTVTFAARGSNGQSQAQGSQRQAVRNNTAGGGAVLTARALQVPPPETNGTMQALMKLGGEIIRPRLEQERTAAYVQGMQKAAQGQAITEIVDEQPWYSQLFGSTSLVDGARAYTANAKANSVAAGMEADMENLRKMSADEFGNYATQAITKNQTGDPTTDMMLAQQISATLPAVMKGQAKAHLRYQQEVFEDKIKSAQTAAFARLGIVDAASRKPGSTKEPDVLGDFIGAIEVLEVPADMKPELHDKILATSAGQALGDGNFAAYRLLRDSGKLTKMSPETANHVERAYNQASQKAKLTAPDEVWDKLADLRSLSIDPNAKEKQVYALADAINGAYTNATGDPSDFVSRSVTLTEITQLRAARQAEANRLANARVAAVTKQGKEIAAYEETTARAERVRGGDGKDSYVMFGVPPAKQQETFDQLRNTASPTVYSRILVSQVGAAVDNTYKDILVSEVTTAKASTDPKMLHDFYHLRYLPLVVAAGDNKEAVAAQYVGPHADTMARYHELAQGKIQDTAHQAAIYSDVVTPRPKEAPKATREAIVKALPTSRLYGSLPFTAMPVKNPDGYADELARTIRSSRDMGDAIDDAKLKQPDLKLVGGYHWRAPSNATDLKTWIGTPANFVDGGVDVAHLDKAVEVLVNKITEDHDIAGTPTIGQTRNSATGEPQFYVVGAGKIVPFFASDLHKVWKSGEGRLDTTDVQSLDLSPQKHADQVGQERATRTFGPQPVKLFGKQIN